MDGVFDLFHIGHLKSIRQCLELKPTKLIIGVVSDDDAASYKRTPTINEDDRATIVQNIVGVDEVIQGCPLVITEEFMNSHSIDLVVHGFANPSDSSKQSDFFKVPIEMGKFQEIFYDSSTSTTDIINTIVAQKD